MRIETLDHRTDGTEAIRAVPFRGVLSDYITLMKPGIVGLVLVSTLSGIYLASGGMVDPALLIWTLLGVGCATAGSAVLNNYTDRDIDPLMKRTSGRALARGTISESNALWFGLVLVALSMAILVPRVNVLTAVLTATATFTYVVLYGMILKRTTPFANQIGGLSGALPPVLGWTAVTGTLGLEASALFLMMAIWQQPHALSLALKYRDDYKKASIPVVPVACGVDSTKLRILLYCIALLPVSTLPYFLGTSGPIYLGLVLLMGTIYIGLSLRFHLSKRSYSMFLFFYSIIYLTVIFTAMVLNTGA